MTVTQFPDPRSAAFLFTADREGGDKPEGKLGDPNHAYRGVNQVVYDAFRRRWGLNHRDVVAMEAPEQAAIYEDYWARAKCEPIAQASGALALCHFDAFFNGGGIVILERTIGETEHQIDEVLTDEEVAALIATLAGESGEAGSCSAYLQNRLDRFRTLKNWPEAGANWTSRLDKLATYLGLGWRAS
jgi:hypothetical protein